jgi:DNA-directed RNA polymerase subunit RPC12/RpoP
MYKCANCKKSVGPNVPMQKHVVYREKTEPYGEGTRTTREIAKEIPVCTECAPKVAAAETMIRVIHAGVSS